MSESKPGFFTQEIRIREKTAYIHIFSDIHVGAHGHTAERFKAAIKWIAERPPNHVLVINGDVFEMALNTSVARTHGGPVPGDEIDQMIELLEPVASRIVLVMPGNHDERATKAVAIDPLVQMVARMRLPPEVYKSHQTALRISLGDRKGAGKDGAPRAHAVGFFNHLWGGGRSIGGKANKVKALSEILADADFYCGGHFHQRIGFDQPIWVGWPPRLKKREYLITPCFLEAEPYASKQGYPPPSVGWACMVVKLDPYDNVLTHAVRDPHLWLDTFGGDDNGE